MSPLEYYECRARRLRVEVAMGDGISYSFAYIGRLEKAGEFPMRIQLGQCRSPGTQTRSRPGLLHARAAFSTQHGATFNKHGVGHITWW
jgi:hypothetical protein